MRHKRDHCDFGRTEYAGKNVEFTIESRDFFKINKIKNILISSTENNNNSNHDISNRKTEEKGKKMENLETKINEKWKILERKNRKNKT